MPTHAPAPRRSLVIPMYQEAKRIGATIDQLCAEADRLGDIELILVDDGSTDGTASLAERQLVDAPFLARVERLERNRGKGGAISAGVLASRGQVVAFADADLSTPPSAIDACFRAVESGDADVVVTTRHTDESNITGPVPIGRRATTGVFRKLLGWRLGLDRYTDTQCGLKAFTRDAATQLFDRLSVQRFAFDVEILLRAEIAGLRVVELPIEWRHVDDSSVRPIRDGARMAVDVMRLRNRVKRWRPAGDAKQALPMLAVLERQHWWYVSHRDVVTDAIAEHHGRLDGRAAAAVGAGTGTMVDRFGELGARLRVGLDPSVDAIAFGRGPVARPAALGASADGALPLADGSVDVVTALDVVAFHDDDHAVATEFARVLRPGGLLALTGPAQRSMWSDYDRALGHRRRYDLVDLERLLDRAGFDVCAISTFHAWLTPLTMLLSRTPLRRLLLQRPERSTFVDARLNRVLLGVTWVERRALRHIRPRFGQAFVAVGRRRAA